MTIKLVVFFLLLGEQNNNYTIYVHDALCLEVQLINYHNHCFL
jgi:hypothetical protein